MKDLNKQKFEEEWRKAFEEAEMAPAGDLWAHLDAHLANQETHKYRSRLIWFQRVAAGILLLLVGGGTWFWAGHQGSRGEKVTGQEQIIASTPSSASVAPGTSQTADAADALARNQSAGDAEGAVTTGNGLRNPASDGGTGNQTSSDAYAKSSVRVRPGKTETPAEESGADDISGRLAASPELTGAKSGRSGNGVRMAPFRPETASNEPLTQDSNGTDPAFSQNTVATEPADAQGEQLPVINGASERLAFGELLPRTLAAKEPDIRPRSIMPYLNDAYWAKIVEEEKKGKSRPDRWQVGVAFAPGSFQPNFQQGGSTSPAFANAALASRGNFNDTSADTYYTGNRELENSRASGVSYQTGVRLEYALSRRFSVQSGVDYLYNSSSINTTSYVQNFLSGRNEPAFASIVNFGNQNRAESMAFADSPATLSYTPDAVSTKQVAQTQTNISVQNVYEYVGIPVKVNYMILNKKLGASVGAGISGDIFLNNRFGNEGAGISEVNLSSAKGTVYRTVAFSAWLGMKMQYRIAGKYSVFFEPSYRTAVTSFTNMDVLQSRPSLFGIGTGLQMRF
jgi:hypothetical protein